jgi:hypothetical protein
MGNRSSIQSGEPATPVAEVVSDALRPSRSCGGGEVPLASEGDDGDEEVPLPLPMAPINQQLLSSAKGGQQSNTKRVSVTHCLYVQFRMKVDEDEI